MSEQKRKTIIKECGWEKDFSVAGELTEQQIVNYKEILKKMINSIIIFGINPENHIKQLWNILNKRKCLKKITLQL